MKQALFALIAATVLCGAAAAYASAYAKPSSLQSLPDLD